MNEAAEIFAEAALPSLMDAMGESVIYVDDPVRPLADPVTLSAILGEEKTITRLDLQDREIKTRSRTVTIGLDDTAAIGGVAAPKESAQFQIDGIRWAIDHAVTASESAITFLCVRKESKEHARNGYRTR